MPRLENWSVCDSEFNPYQAPECQSKVLRGQIYDDENERWDDGTTIRTSRLVELDTKNKYAQTLNTKYILGEPSEDYLKWLKDNGIDPII
jgi:hypothetical protein